MSSNVAVLLVAAGVFLLCIYATKEGTITLKLKMFGANFLLRTHRAAMPANSTTDDEEVPETKRTSDAGSQSHSAAEA